METKPRAVALITQHPELQTMCEKISSRRKALVDRIEFFQRATDKAILEMRKEETADWEVIEKWLFYNKLLTSYDDSKLLLDMNLETNLVQLKNKQTEIPEFIKRMFDQ